MRKQKKQVWKRWQKITVTVAVILLVSGLGLLLFPTISNHVGQLRANAEIDSFNSTIENAASQDASDTNGVTAQTREEALAKGEIDEDGYVLDENGARASDAPVVFQSDLDALYRDSLAYNESLINHQGTVDTSDYATAALKMSRYGLSNLYCYLSAPAIDLYLPVYLGANDAMMSYGAAHLSGTSLPVDQDNTNVAIAGHTGYIGRIFFDNIRRLEIGDTVTIRNYREELSYQVIGCKVVKESETADIYIQPGRRLLTLITCISNSRGGFDRYLVICENLSS